MLIVAILFGGLFSGTARAEEADQALSSGELAQLVAPIALYPDTLLTQVLMASTYPLDVVAAARWSQQNPNAKGQALEAAMQRQNWDPSVKALTALPQILKMMSEQLDWMQRLGDAFLAQPDELFDAVQDMRARAEAAGHLKTTDEQRVTRVQRPASFTPVQGAPAAPDTVIVIESVRPETYFVPIYDPGIVFGAWPFPAYRPFFWYPPGWAVSNAFSFTTGVFVGAAIWGNVNWWNRNVNINVNRYNSFNRTRIANNNWTHNPANRRGVPYRNPNVSRRFNPDGGAARRNASDRIQQGKGIGGGMQGAGGIGGVGGMKGSPGSGIGGMKGTGGGMKGTGGGMKGTGGGMKGTAGGMKGTGAGMKGGPSNGMGGMKGGSSKKGSGIGGGGMAGGGMVGGGMAGGGMVGGGMAGGGMVGGGMAGGGMVGGGMAGGGMGLPKR
jgi:Protein of unknown function (DUF3300)